MYRVAVVFDGPVCLPQAPLVEDILNGHLYPASTGPHSAAGRMLTLHSNQKSEARWPNKTYKKRVHRRDCSLGRKKTC